MCKVMEGGGVVGASAKFEPIGGVRGVSHVRSDGGVRGVGHVQGDDKGIEGRQPCSR